MFKSYPLKERKTFYEVPVQSHNVKKYPIECFPKHLF